MIKDLGFARLGLRDQRLIQHVEHILAHLFEFGLDLGAVLPDRADVLLRALGLLLLLDRGDDTPGGTSSSNHVLVSNRQQVTLIHGEFTTKLTRSWSDCIRMAGVLSSSRGTGFCQQQIHTLATSYSHVSPSPAILHRPVQYASGAIDRPSCT